MKEVYRPSQIIIRESNAKDAEPVINIRREAWLCAYPNEEAGFSYAEIEQKVNQDLLPDKLKAYQERLSSNDTYRRWIVAEVEGKVVGYAFAEIIDDSRILQVLNVHPEYFGKGVGQALIDSAIKWLGGNNVELTVVKHNHRAIKFYQKNGFVIDGEAYDEAAMLPSGKVMPEWRMVKNIK